MACAVPLLLFRSYSGLFLFCGRFRFEQDSQRIGPAVRGNGTAGMGGVDFLELHSLPDRLPNQLFPGRVDGGIGNEEMIPLDIGILGQLIPHIEGSTFSRLPRYFFPTCMLPSELSTSIQGFRFSRFAPKATTDEQRPPARMKSSVSKIKLAWQQGMISKAFRDFRRAFGADQLSASMTCRAMPVEREQLSTGYTWPPSSFAASRQFLWALEIPRPNSGESHQSPPPPRG